MDEGEHLSAELGTFRLLERMLYLSDAVFAIVLTLLVLELRLPPGVTDANLFQGIRAMEPRLVAFVTTFALVSVFWIAHVSIARRLTKFDWPVAWVNLLFLFTIAMTPFASTLLGDYSVFGNAWRFYCLELIAIGVAQIVLFLVIWRDRGRLVGEVSRREYWHRFVRAASVGVAFAIALATSLAGLTRLSFYLMWVLVPAILIGARLLLGPGRAVTVTKRVT
jgi:uncharacterized membrane protein